MDRFVFTLPIPEVHHIKEGRCDNCGEDLHLWRLVEAIGYDKSNAKPIFLCLKCFKEKTDELRLKGIPVRGKSK